MRNGNFNVLSAVDTSSQNGIQIDANQIIAASFQAVFGDSTADGVFKIQMSNDICNDRYQANQFTVTNWTDIPNASASIVSGGSAVITIPQVSYRWLRAVYVSSSGGSSTVNVNIDSLSL